MQLHLLGTTGYHPNERRQTACFMLPEIGVVFDAGTGMHRVKRHLQTRRLDVFLSHAHLDHVVGLTYLLGDLWNEEMEQVNVHGEVEKLAAIDEHLHHPLHFPIDHHYANAPLVEGQPVAVAGGGRVTHFALEHPGGSVGYRLDLPDRSMAYVTDTTAAAEADYVEQIRGVDLLVHECYFHDDQAEFAAMTGHSCATPVAQVAAAAEVGRLILVHINPMSEADDPIGLDRARAVFPATEIGEDLQVVEF